jgi:hypothetical protein
MYVLEGKLKVQDNPEIFIGQYGVFHQTVDRYAALQGTETRTDTFRATGSTERLADAAARKWRRNGDIPADLIPEHITSLEQAEKYAAQSDRAFVVSRFRFPDLGSLLNLQVKENEKLLEGQAQLWKERRLPTPYVYFLGLGKILADVEYVPDEGWYHRYHEVTGSRTRKGLLTPVKKTWRETSHYEGAIYNRPPKPV